MIDIAIERPKMVDISTKGVVVRGKDGKPGTGAVTKESIKEALGYTPANEDKVADLESIRQIDKSKLTAPETATVGQIFAVKAVNEDGTLVLEAVDKPEGESVDVQINGTSIVQDGIAEIPYAGNSKFGGVGLVRAGGNYGLKYWSSTDPLLMIDAATEGNVKNGDWNYNPIVPSKQQYSAFYGLAKAAGHDEKNSTLPLGQYTDEAKEAIQQMIGILSSEGVLFGE